MAVRSFWLIAFMSAAVVAASQVVPGKHERCEIDLARELEQASQSRRSRIEDGRPGLDMRDVFEAAGERLQQLRLTARRSEKNTGLIHRASPFGSNVPFLPT
jgi:hypothetical protein